MSASDGYFVNASQLPIGKFCLRCNEVVGLSHRCQPGYGAISLSVSIQEQRRNADASLHRWNRNYDRVLGGW